MPTLNFPHFIYGGDYNPEQWDETVWLEDARLMQEAGVNLVSLGIFAWSKLEPRQDEFNFNWLDRIMDLLHAHGVKVNLATPTASPPPGWFAGILNPYPSRTRGLRFGMADAATTVRTVPPTSPARTSSPPNLLNAMPIIPPLSYGTWIMNTPAASLPVTATPPSPRSVIG